MPPTLDDVFTLALGAEIEAREFYSGLAAMFPGQKDVVMFFEGMMRDEEEHIKAIGRMRDMLGPEALAAATDPDLIHKARTFLSFNAQQQLAMVQSLDDAYTLAVNLEFSEVNKLMDLLIAANMKDREEHRRMHDALGLHQDKIRAFPRSFGDAEWRRSVKPVR